MAEGDKSRGISLGMAVFTCVLAFLGSILGAWISTGPGRAQVDQSYVELAVHTLSEEPSALTPWAADVLNHYAPENVKLPEDVYKRLRDGELRLPVDVILEEFQRQAEQLQQQQAFAFLGIAHSPSGPSEGFIKELKALADHGPEKNANAARSLLESLEEKGTE